MNETENPDRHALQADGKHPAPCARFCEAEAFNIQLRQLRKQLATVTSERDELARHVLTPLVFNRLLDWLQEEPSRTAVDAFDAGIERQIAYALELTVLPEVKRLRSQLETALAGKSRPCGGCSGCGKG